MYFVQLVLRPPTALTVVLTHTCATRLPGQVASGPRATTDDFSLSSLEDPPSLRRGQGAEVGGSSQMQRAKR